MDLSLSWWQFAMRQSNRGLSKENVGRVACKLSGPGVKIFHLTISVQSLYVDESFESN